MSENQPTPSITVRGETVPRASIVAGLRYMWGDDAFWREDVAGEMERSGCPQEVAAEAAGRLMQWAKRRGLVHRPFDDYWGPTLAFSEEEFPYA